MSMVSEFGPALKITSERFQQMVGVPEYWLIDIEKRRIEVYTDPSDDGYRSMRTVVETAELAPVFAPESPTQAFNLLPRK